MLKNQCYGAKKIHCEFKRNYAYCAAVVKFVYLTLFRPGGGRILPAATLDVNNIFNIKANYSKVGDFC